MLDPIFYCGVNETKWNRHPVMPGEFACIAPVYGASVRTKTKNAVKIPDETEVIQDSGAFSDGIKERLSLAAALDRQIGHGIQYKYDTQITHRASYDLLIDEMWADGVRTKSRWSELDAEFAVQETIDAANFIKNEYSGPAILSAQGVTPSQYISCAERICGLLDSNDIFGMGGWCISGKMPKQMHHVFTLTIVDLIPMLAKRQVSRIHIWGVMDVKFLGPLLWMCDNYNIQMSTDSSGPQVRPTRGTWGYRGWVKKDYKIPDVETRGIHRAMHVKLARCWVKNGIRKSPYYAEPTLARIKNRNGYIQKELFSCM